MTTYTEQDFAKASFARNPDGGIAVRLNDDDAPWFAEDENWHSDATMASYGWVPVREAAAQPITLDTLQAAWEGAEQGEVAEGDVLIRRSGENFTVWVAGGGWSTEALSRSGHTRILHRAPKPKREPWQDLADVLRAHTGEPEPEETAKMLHERGVRVTEEMSAEYA